MASRQLKLGAFMRPASIHPGAWRYPGATPDANFNFATLRHCAQKLEAVKFDAFFMADHMAVLNLPPEALKRKATCVEVRQDVHDNYFADIQRRQKSTVFLNHNCSLSNSYYFDKHGDAPMLRPSTSVEMLWRAKHLPMENYRFTKAMAKR